MNNISMTTTTQNDAKFLLRLKNDKDVRKWSIVSKDKIEMKDHLEWLKRNIKNIFIIYYDNKRCGDVRIDYDNYISIKLHKKYRGMGIASYILRIFTLSKPNISAKIVDGNVPSMRLFIKNGFKVIDHKITNGVGYYILKYENNTSRTRGK